MSNSGSGAVDEQETDPNKANNESTATVEAVAASGHEIDPRTRSVEVAPLSESLVSDTQGDGETKMQSAAAEQASSSKQDEPAEESTEPGASSGGDGAAEPVEGRRTFSKIHVSHILDEVLEESAETAALPEETRKRLRYPMFVDLFLGFGLLVAMGGFTVGLFNMYLVHAAADSINKSNYEAAVHILSGAPMPQVFAMPGSDTEELMSQAIYLDAFEKTKAGRIDDAIQQLKLIKPGSKYFAGAQHLISDNTERAEILLEGGAETLETSPPPQVKKTATERALQDED